MKTYILTHLATLMLLAGNLISAEPPEMPQPTKEHEWLKKFVGEWDVETELFMEPGKPAMKVKGLESARMIGGFWVVGETKGEMMGAPFTGLMTFGYNPEKKKYVGTWVDSHTSTLWQYLGSVDPSGKILTMETEGYCPMEKQICQFKDTVEFKSNDHRVLTGTKLGKDGKWTTAMIVTARRKN